MDLPKFARWALCLALAAAAAALVGCEKKPKTAGSQQRGSFVVDVVTVATGPLKETLSATGSLVPNESVQLQSERSGIVDKISFEEGMAVKQGEVLLTIDSSELQAQLQRAQAQLQLTKTVEGRQRDLLKNRGISESEYDQSTANLAIAQAEVALILAQIEKTKVHAPFDGRTGLRRVSIGSYLTPGTPISSFQDLDPLKVDFSLPERYLNFVKVGQKLTFRIAGRGEEFAAQITAIEPSIDITTRSLIIRAVVPNEEQRLLPGSFAEIDVSLPEIPDAILIPAIALVPGLKQQKVLILKDGKVEERVVQTGLRTADSVQILQGLTPGEELITSGVLQLRAGMKVEAKRAAASPPLTNAAPSAGERQQPQAKTQAKES